MMRWATWILADDPAAANALLEAARPILDGANPDLGVRRPSFDLIRGDDGRLTRIVVEATLVERLRALGVEDRPVPTLLNVHGAIRERRWFTMQGRNFLVSPIDLDDPESSLSYGSYAPRFATIEQINERPSATSHQLEVQEQDRLDGISTRSSWGLVAPIELRFVRGNNGNDLFHRQGDVNVPGGLPDTILLLPPTVVEVDADNFFSPAWVSLRRSLRATIERPWQGTEHGSPSLFELHRQVDRSVIRDWLVDGAALNLLGCDRKLDTTETLRDPDPSVLALSLGEPKSARRMHRQSFYFDRLPAEPSGWAALKAACRADLRPFSFGDASSKFMIRHGPSRDPRALLPYRLTTDFDGEPTFDSESKQSAWDALRVLEEKVGEQHSALYRTQVLDPTMNYARTCADVSQALKHFVAKCFRAPMDTLHPDWLGFNEGVRELVQMAAVEQPYGFERLSRERTDTFHLDHVWEPGAPGGPVMRVVPRSTAGGGAPFRITPAERRRLRWLLPLGARIIEGSLNRLDDPMSKLDVSFLLS